MQKNILTLKILFVFAVVFLFSNNYVFSQNENEKPVENPKKTSKADNFVFGGSIGLQFGTETYVEVSPLAGYYLTPKLLLAAGLTYQYYGLLINGKSLSSNIFGGRIYSEYSFIENIGQNLRIKSNYSVFGHVEYEALSLDRDFSDSKSYAKINRFWLNGILIGVGIKQSIGKFSSFNITILYNVNANSRTPYSNPLLRIGFYL